jgi:hypothetical protein
VRYFTERWGERRGDAYNHWGASTWFFECDEQLRVKRQIEVYENGRVHHYDEAHPEDEFGALAEKALGKESLKSLKEIEAQEFERVWTSQRPSNR